MFNINFNGYIAFRNFKKNIFLLLFFVHFNNIYIYSDNSFGNLLKQFQNPI